MSRYGEYPMLESHGNVGSSRGCAADTFRKIISSLPVLMQTHKQLVILTLKKYPCWVVSSIADEYLFAKQDGWMDIWGIVEKIAGLWNDWNSQNPPFSL